MSSAPGPNEGLADIGGKGATSPEETGPKRGIPWRERIQESISCSRQERGGNFVQIATVDGDGAPRCRTVVFRGFQPYLPGCPTHADGGAALKMITDARSEKVAQAQSNPKCEMVWWFAKSKEQYRIAGVLQFVGQRALGGTLHPELERARLDQWRKLTDAAREQFYWPQPGGDPVVDVSSPPPPGGRDDEGTILNPPETFLLMLLWPTQVKYLRLTDNAAALDCIRDDGSWSTAGVNP